ncbi:phytoene synthase [Novosphingobium hassiacum]|uniref:Phytoene synthase n=1 Tax=Novosphingobium hassiacum TaxID=173676 RepID=A0A7W6EWE6_9SPHN|nr:hypothetical protein [Novosphingobium hassiacum]MBB3861213.1 phytoene synthase [Novosphingobium hassiacum]
MLDPIERLALSYAPRSARAAWEALIFFNLKLAEAAKPGREPMMIQLRLSWWRDRLSEPADSWPKGEPVLAGLKVWEREAAALIGLVDGWEAKIVGEDGGVELAQAQIESYVALARLLGETELADVRQTAAQLITPGRSSSRPPKLARAMRPLAILRALAMRTEQGGEPTPLRDLAMLMRVGLLGR